MNRRKKIKSILTKKEKMSNRHNNLNKKPKYISKADRAKLEEEQANNQGQATPLAEDTQTSN